MELSWKICYFYKQNLFFWEIFLFSLFTQNYTLALNEFFIKRFKQSQLFSLQSPEIMKKFSNLPWLENFKISVWGSSMNDH